MMRRVEGMHKGTHLEGSIAVKFVSKPSALTSGCEPSRRISPTAMEGGMNWSSGTRALTTRANGLLPHWNVCVSLCHYELKHGRWFTFSGSRTILPTAPVFWNKWSHPAAAVSLLWQTSRISCASASLLQFNIVHPAAVVMSEMVSWEPHWKTRWIIIWSSNRWLYTYDLHGPRCRPSTRWLQDIIRAFAPKTGLCPVICGAYSAHNQKEKHQRTTRSHQWNHRTRRYSSEEIRSD